MIPAAALAASARLPLPSSSPGSVQALSNGLGQSLDKPSSPVIARVLAGLSRLAQLWLMQVRKACLGLPRQVARHGLPGQIRCQNRQSMAARRAPA